MKNFKLSTKTAIVGYTMLVAVIFCGCSSEKQNETLNNPQGHKTIEVEGCEYLQYDAEMYCGHQYNHHTYNARLITHKGNCKFCAERSKK